MPCAAINRYAARISASVTMSMIPPDSSRAAVGAIPARRIADLDRGRHRMRIVNRMADHDRRRFGGLIAHHLRQPRRKPVALVLAIAGPIRGDVARVADRQKMMGRRVAKLIANLERRGLLSRDTIGVNAVDQPESAPDRVSARSRTTFRQMSKLPIISITRAPCITLCESLPSATAPLGINTKARSPGPPRIRGGRGRGVAGRGADRRSARPRPGPY